MGPVDLAYAERNCFPHLMVNLRPAGLSAVSPLNRLHPPHAAETWDPCLAFLFMHSGTLVLSFLT